MRERLFGAIAQRAALAVALVTLIGCGQDELLDSQSLPDHTPGSKTHAGQSDAGTLAARLDVCAAAGSFLAAPGVVEGLCVNRGQAGCVQCTKLTKPLLLVAGNLNCPNPVQDCSTDQAHFDACAKEAGERWGSQFEDCANSASVSPEESLTRAFGSGACLQVLLNCPAAVDALRSSLGGSMFGRGRR